jgi:hypothetical protein
MAADQGDLLIDDSPLLVLQILLLVNDNKYSISNAPTWQKMMSNIIQEATP